MHISADDHMTHCVPKTLTDQGHARVHFTHVCREDLVFVRSRLPGRCCGADCTTLGMGLLPAAFAMPTCASRLQTSMLMTQPWLSRAHKPSSVNQAAAQALKGRLLL